MFLPLIGECELDNLDYLVIQESLRHLKQREVLEVPNALVDRSDKITCPGVLGIQ